MGRTDLAAKCYLRSRRLALLDASFMVLQDLPGSDCAHLATLLSGSAPLPDGAATGDPCRLVDPTVRDDIGHEMSILSPARADRLHLLRMLLGEEPRALLREGPSLRVRARLVLTLTRAVLHGIANNRTSRAPTPPPWPILSRMVGELDAACRALLRCLESTLPLVEQGLSVPEADRLQLECCFDCFAVRCVHSNRLMFSLSSLFPPDPTSSYLTAPDLT